MCRTYSVSQRRDTQPEKTDMVTFKKGDKVWVRTPGGFHAGVVEGAEKHPMFTSLRYSVRWAEGLGSGWCDETLTLRTNAQPPRN